MKKTLTTVLMMVFYVLSFSQPAIRPLSRHNPPGFDEAIQAVIFDFSTNFRNIQGPLVNDEAEYEKYASLVELPGAEQSVITRFHSVEDTTASWQAVMLTTEEYDEAAALYKKICQRMKATKLSLPDGSQVQFRSDYQPPSTENKFTSSFYYLPHAEGEYMDLRVQVELIVLLGEYKVLVNVHPTSKV
ncbi:hypothetical protein [Flavihumibacter sp. ZG627]|uniref:hypothetical protein n=1 Tax=Flavihumibacter sp. ZG627 TaxID=1463156 RepID=UPI00057F1A11|nr:hypothetical protein [Flavihumibacter sp. ZG627]KIC91771.1 hypothetical protein HY58_06025 [Flavihumibacter sp. ZG627]